MTKEREVTSRRLADERERYCGHQLSSITEPTHTERCFGSYKQSHLQHTRGNKEQKEQRNKNNRCTELGSGEEGCWNRGSTSHRDPNQDQIELLSFGRGTSEGNVLVEIHTRVSIGQTGLVIPGAAQRSSSLSLWGDRRSKVGSILMRHPRVRLRWAISVRTWMLLLSTRLLKLMRPSRTWVDTMRVHARMRHLHTVRHHGTVWCAHPTHVALH